MGYYGVSERRLGRVERFEERGDGKGKDDLWTGTQKRNANLTPYMRFLTGELDRWEVNCHCSPAQGSLTGTVHPFPDHSYRIQYSITDVFSGDGRI